MKQKIYNHCLQLLNKKIGELNDALRAVTEAANNETKSSVGDKHETARAMMQLEQEKIGKQLKEAVEQRSELKKIDLTRIPERISKGSLVKSNKGYLFISIGLGKIVVGDQTIFVISPQSPLGKKLIGLKEGDTAEMGNLKYLIQKLY